MYDFLKKSFKKINLKKGAVLEDFEKWVPPARSTDGRRGAGDLPPIQQAGGPKTFRRPLPRASWFLIREEAPNACGDILPVQRAGGPPRGTPPARCGTFDHHCISPHLTPNSHIIQQKSGKKEREERKRGEKAAKPCSHIGLEVYSCSSRIIT
jgi:hypothetical protein